MEPCAASSQSPLPPQPEFWFAPRWDLANETPQFWGGGPLGSGLCDTSTVKPEKWSRSSSPCSPRSLEPNGCPGRRTPRFPGSPGGQSSQSVDSLTEVQPAYNRSDEHGDDLDIRKQYEELLESRIAVANAVKAVLESPVSSKVSDASPLVQRKERLPGALSRTLPGRGSAKVAATSRMQSTSSSLQSPRASALAATPAKAVTAERLSLRGPLPKVGALQRSCSASEVRLRARMRTVANLEETSPRTGLSSQAVFVSQSVGSQSDCSLAETAAMLLTSKLHSNELGSEAEPRKCQAAAHRESSSSSIACCQTASSQPQRRQRLLPRQQPLQGRNGVGRRGSSAIQRSHHEPAALAPRSGSAGGSGSGVYPAVGPKQQRLDTLTATGAADESSSRRPCERADPKEMFDCSFSGVPLHLPQQVLAGLPSDHVEEVCLGGDIDDASPIVLTELDDNVQEQDEEADEVTGLGFELCIKGLPPEASDESVRRICQAFGLQVKKIRIACSDARVSLGSLPAPEGETRARELVAFLEQRAGCTIVMNECYGVWT